LFPTVSIGFSSKNAFQEGDFQCIFGELQSLELDGDLCPPWSKFSAGSISLKPKALTDV